MKMVRWEGEWSAKSLAARIVAGEIAPDAGVARALEAIETLNPRLNAIVDFDRNVVDPQLDHLKARLAAGDRLPLAGVPVTVKDHIHVAGWRVTEGSLVFKGRVAHEDEVVVTRLREAGAVLIGRTNMSEFGSKGVTTNLVYGPTRHPLDETLTTGGSSGGAAAAVAAGLAPLALASDGGGSVRRPAAHAGVVGVKPSPGLIANPSWSSHRAVFGVMAANVGDCIAMLDALIAREPRDPTSVGWDADLGQPDHPLRIAWSPRLGLEVPVDGDVTECLDLAINRLKEAGLNITRTDPVWPEGAGEDAVMPIQHGELACDWGDLYRQSPEMFDPDIAVQIESGLRLSAVDILRAEAMSAAISRAAARFFASDVDLLLSPTTPCVAWPHTQLGPTDIGGVRVAHRGHAVFTPLFNHAFCPATSIPAGAGRGGLPVGLQIVGPRFADRRVLHFANQAEKILAQPS